MNSMLKNAHKTHEYIQQSFAERICIFMLCVKYTYNSSLSRANDDKRQFEKG